MIMAIELICLPTTRFCHNLSRISSRPSPTRQNPENPQRQKAQNRASLLHRSARKMTKYAQRYVGKTEIAVFPNLSLCMGARSRRAPNATKLWLHAAVM